MTLEFLPATAPEIAAELGVSVKTINARLQSSAKHGKCRRTDRAVKPREKQRGRYPHIRERT